MYKVASTVLMRCACIELRIIRVIRIFRHILVYLAFRKLKNFSFRITLCSVCVSLWLGVIHLKDSIDWPISDEIWYEHCAPGGRSNPVLLTLPRSVITMRRIDVLVRGDNNGRHNTHKIQTSISPAGFEHTIPASERLQSHALDREATRIGV
jgi:hypothetical protein